jgi:chromosome segregation ATPase
MADRNSRSRGELAKAELTVQELEAQLEHVRTLIRERKAEKQSFSAQSQAAAAAGDVNRLVTIENRSVVVDKTINELLSAETECAERVEAARRYLFTLYVRLEKLRKEARDLMRRIDSIEDPHGEIREVQTSLSRVKVQIKAIVGEVQTGQLLTGLGAK